MVKARLLSQVLWYACSRLLICNDAVLVLQLLAMSCCWWRGWQDLLAWFLLCVSSLNFCCGRKGLFVITIFTSSDYVRIFGFLLVWFRVQKIAIENQRCSKWNTLVAWKNCFLESFGLSHKQNSVKTNDSTRFFFLWHYLWWSDGYPDNGDAFRIVALSLMSYSLWNV